MKCPVIKPITIRNVIKNGTQKTNMCHNFGAKLKPLRKDIAYFENKTPLTKEKLISEFNRISVSNHSGFADLTPEGIEACKTYDKFLVSLLQHGCKFDQYPINVVSNYWGGAGWSINFEKLGKNMQRYNLLKNSKHFKKNPSEMEQIIFKQYIPAEEKKMFDAINDKKIPRNALIDICNCGYSEEVINFYKKFHKQVRYKDLNQLSNQPIAVYNYAKELLKNNKNIVKLNTKNLTQDLNATGERSIETTLTNGLKEIHYLKSNAEGTKLTRKEIIHSEMGNTVIVTENAKGETINETILRKGKTPYGFSSLILKTNGKTQSWVPSKIEGNYNIYEHDSNGKKYLIGLAEINKETGARHI